MLAVPRRSPWLSNLYTIGAFKGRQKAQLFQRSAQRRCWPMPYSVASTQRQTRKRMYDIHICDESGKSMFDSVYDFKGVVSARGRHWNIFGPIRQNSHNNDAPASPHPQTSCGTLAGEQASQTHRRTRPIILEPQSPVEIAQFGRHLPRHRRLA
jgi:hypothetical protein